MASIGIDLGGTKIYGVRLKGADLDVVAEAKGKTPVQGGPLVIGGKTEGIFPLSSLRGAAAVDRPSLTGSPT